MGHSLYHIAYEYYKDRFLAGDRGGKPSIVGELFKKLLEGNGEQPQQASVGRRILGAATGFVVARQIKKLSDTERLLVEDFSRLFAEDRSPDSAGPLMDDRRTFELACQISHVLGYSFLCRFMDFARQGRFMESLQTVASLGPVALSMAPYFAAFSTQHKDQDFSARGCQPFPCGTAPPRISRRRAWLTDTYTDVNGVSRTIQALAATARTMGRQLTVITCQEDTPPCQGELKNFKPVGTFPMPEYESQAIAFPPFLEVIDYIERSQFDELIISTPGPIGLVGLAAARLLGLRVTAIYHTDFVQYVRCLTQDDDMADLTWKYMLWFYEQTAYDSRPDGVLPRSPDPSWFHRQQAAGDGPGHRRPGVPSRASGIPPSSTALAWAISSNSFTWGGCRGRRTPT